MPPKSPFEDRSIASIEGVFKSIFFGKLRGGIFGQLREPPSPGKDPKLASALAGGRSEEILSSEWWAGIWGAGEDAAQRELERIATVAAPWAFRRVPRSRADRALYIEGTERLRAHQTSHLVGFLDKSERLTEARALAVAVRSARARAVPLIAEIKGATAAGLRDIVAGIPAARHRAIREVMAEFAAKLGPTGKQAARIRQWELEQTAAGVPRPRILAGIKARSRNAIRSRVEVAAGDEFASQVNRTIDAVYSEAGLFIFSQNMRDARVRQRHAQQTRITRALLVPAGAPWPAAAPFQDGPPYEPRCRCWRERFDARDVPRALA